MKIKHIKTYLFTGQIDIIDKYEVIVDKEKLKKYKEDNDISLSLEELIDDIPGIDFGKKYYNNSISFKLVSANEFVDDYGNSDKELLDETIEII